MEQAPFVEIVTIGDEILYGQITDTNAQWLAAHFGKAGFRIIRKTTISDQREAILHAMKEASVRAKIVVTTGGLGPTKDDITKKTFAEYFGTEMTHRPEVLENIAQLFRQRGRELTKLNESQAEVPANGEVIMNTVGTAPGMWFEYEGCFFISMPGVPHEMKKMMKEVVIPRLQAHFDTPHILHRMVKTIGMPESKLALLLEEWEEGLPENIKLAYLPRFGQVRLRLTTEGRDLPELQRKIEAEVQKLKPIIGKYVYAYDDEEIEKSIGELLKAEGKRLAVAESCTGGTVVSKITAIPGSSAYFQGGVVAYSNEVKKDILGVKTETLEQFGAVSEQTAKEMAAAVRQKLGADIGLSTTGVAGPTGGTPEKPVGTVWIGYSDTNETFALLLQLTKDRHMNINFTHNAVMTLLNKKLKGEEFVNAFAKKGT